MSINRTAWKGLVALSIAALAITACEKDGGSQGQASSKNQASSAYVAPEALSMPSSQFSQALLDFGTRVQAENLAGYSRAAREDILRGGIRDFLEGGNWGAEGFSATMADATVLLCKPRYGYLRVATPLQNTNAKANAIKDLLAPTSDDAKVLLQNLLKKYTIDVTDQEVPDSYAKWLADAQGRPCADAVRDADPFATRDYIGREFAIAGVLAAKALFETVWGIVKPALVGTLKNVDLERRNVVVRNYFADSTNVTALKVDVEHSEGFLQREIALQQRRTAGFAAGAAAVVLDYNSPQWKEAMRIAERDPCPTALRRLPERHTDVEGVVCLNGVYEKLSTSINKALDAADHFDASLEKQLPKTRLSAQLDTLAEIAQGKNPPEEQMRALWGTLVRYASLFNTIKDTASDANKKKVNDALDALKKAFD
jgi:hypothetical protein